MYTSFGPRVCQFVQGIDLGMALLVRGCAYPQLYQMKAKLFLKVGVTVYIPPESAHCSVSLPACGSQALKLLPAWLVGRRTSGDLNLYFPLTKEAEHPHVFIENPDFLFSEEIFFSYGLHVFILLLYKSFLIFWKGILLICTYWKYIIL